VSPVRRRVPEHRSWDRRRTALLADARAEAVQLRATARTLLTDARSEVDALARRRSAITAELGQLSGVIEALAVPEAAPRTHPPTGETVADDGGDDETIVIAAGRPQTAGTDARAD
jgi:hypothetical protein